MFSVMVGPYNPTYFTTNSPWPDILTIQYTLPLFNSIGFRHKVKLGSENSNFIQGK